ncbi:MAG: hypothetical protein WBS19_07585 [Candidatus Korobacteraceae bacterium]|jgi:hypothetical protein
MAKKSDKQSSARKSSGKSAAKKKVSFAHQKKAASKRSAFRGPDTHGGGDGEP